MKDQTTARFKRPLLLWASALWLFALGVIDGWRSITLWQTRRLLAELGSSLSPSVSVLLALGWAICGAGLIAAAIGLWLRREWARHVARAGIVVHVIMIQVYTWAFVRTGLLWERRWSTLVLSILATAAGFTALTWSRSRHWLGLEQTSKQTTTT